MVPWARPVENGSPRFYCPSRLPVFRLRSHDTYPQRICHLASQWRRLLWHLVQSDRGCDRSSSLPPTITTPRRGAVIQPRDFTRPSLGLFSFFFSFSTRGTQERLPADDFLVFCSPRLVTPSRKPP
ncbi:hypothetical protein BDZ89DRAFT_121663 [Hymenopellis radicata]|nr:hypothetical protein BDZ89DRAFT_121663 [Hymenopellis radicata]